MLSLKERDRRWKLIREEMKKRNLSCLIVSGLGRGSEHTMFNHWIADDDGIPFTIFPPEGEPTCFVAGTQRVFGLGAAREAAAQEKTELWVSDYRQAAVSSEGIVSRLRELKVESGKVGVTGIGAHWDAEGNIPYTTWSRVLQGLPKVTFEDADWWMTEISLPKSDEELVLVKRAADICEEACRALLAVAKPGVSEDHIYNAIMSCIQHERATRLMPFLLGSGTDSLKRAFQPEWLHTGGAPRVIRAGDIITSEIGPWWAGYSAQVQFFVALNPVDKLHEKCHDVTQDWLKAIEKTLRPGVKFGEAAEAAEAPLKEAGTYYISPMIHSMNPQVLRSTHSMDYRTGRAVDSHARLAGDASRKFVTFVRGADITIKKGMIFELEPNACFEDHRVLIGGTVVVEDSGLKRLNRLAFEMQRI